jgi:hypothetical protein
MSLVLISVVAFVSAACNDEVVDPDLPPKDASADKVDGAASDAGDAAHDGSKATDASADEATDAVSDAADEGAD